MSTTYAINVVRGTEFDTETELRRIGATPWVARRLDRRWIKEKKDFAYYDVPYVPKLMFAVFPAALWPDVRAVKNIIGKPVALKRGDMRGVKAHRIQRQDGTFKDIPAVHGLEDFRDAVMAEYSAMQRVKENSEYECMFTPGQALDILGTAMEGLPAEFSHTIRSARDGYAKLVLNVDLMGGKVAVEVDPHMVAAK